MTQSPPKLLEVRITELSVPAKQVLTVGQLIEVTLAALATLSVRQFVPPSVVVAISPALPTALQTAALGQSMPTNGPELPASGSAPMLKLTFQWAPPSTVERTWPGVELSGAKHVAAFGQLMALRPWSVTFAGPLQFAPPSADLVT